MKNNVLCITAIILLMVLPLMGFTLIGDNDNRTEPVIIDAPRGLICEANGSSCTGFGHVRAQKGTSVLSSQKMIAYFKATKGTKRELLRLDAFKDVVFTDVSKGYTATGTYGFYDAEAQLLTLEGQPILKDNTTTVFVGSKIIFDENRNMAVVTGRSTLKRDQQLLQADLMYVYFQKDITGQLVFERIDVEGNVIISTPTEIARGKRGIYRSNNNVAELFDNVSITRDTGQLNGNYAKYDMAKGHGQMYNRPDYQELQQPRVQALLKPVKKK